MKTDDLISAIVADTQPTRLPMRTRQLLVVGSGAFLLLMAILLGLYIRADILDALGSWRFELKIAVTVLTAVMATAATLELARPTAKPSLSPVLPAALLLMLAIAIEVWSTPSSDWTTRLVGENALICMASITILAIGPLLALLYAIRSDAPASPGAAGAMAGLSAAAIAATVYALHCTDDSPLFVATWYVLATLAVTLAGALAGRRVLRW